MTQAFKTRPLQFYLTAPGPCPYLEGREERKVFTHVTGPDRVAVADALSQAGFRRSQSVIYRPACEACQACLSARIGVDRAQLSKSQRRAVQRNKDLIRTVRPASPTDEQFELLCRYLTSRHTDGGMDGMAFGEYALMVSDTPARTQLTEYRDDAGKLLAAMIVDVLADGLSLVYSFFDPREEKRSLGTFLVLDHVEQARALGLAFVYLGYWIEDSPKMAYKARFRPLEVLERGGWRELDTDTGA